MKNDPDYFEKSKGFSCPVFLYWLVLFNVLTTVRSLREGAPLLIVCCEGSEAQYLHRPHRESNPGSLRDSPLHNRCATPAPPCVLLFFDIDFVVNVSILHFLFLNFCHM